MEWGSENGRGGKKGKELGGWRVDGRWVSWGE